MKNFENLHSDIQKELFDKLSEEEKAKRVVEFGEEGSIQQYGYEMALKSAEENEQEMSPEELEQFKKLKLGAKNVIKSFSLKRSADNKKGENLLIVTDSGADNLMVKALHEAGKEIAGDDCRVMVAPKTEHAAQEFGESIGGKMKTADAVLLLTSLSRSHSKETVELIHPHHSLEVIAGLLNSPVLEHAFLELREKYSPEELVKLLSERKFNETSMFPSRSRIISITNTDREILTTGGALEDPIEMAERIDRFAEVMKGVEKVKIKSEDGSELELDIKVPTLMKDNGIMEKPGTAGNFPNGEYAGSVDLTDTNGTVIIDGAIGMIGRVDQPVKITIKNGVAIKIEGGESAQKLQEILDKANKEHREKNPKDESTNAFKLAEFSFGMNSKAFRYTEDGKRISPPTSLEGEKGLGTIHIALGKNTLFSVPKDDPDYNNIPIHIDCVSMNTSIKGIKEDGEEVELVRNGEVICL